jgi:hypothetical protein
MNHRCDFEIGIGILRIYAEMKHAARVSDTISLTITHHAALQ